jgi:hypothetical protein
MKLRPLQFFSVDDKYHSHPNNRKRGGVGREGRSEGEGEEESGDGEVRKGRRQKEEKSRKRV